MHYAPDDGYFRVHNVVDGVADAISFSELGKEALKFGPGGEDALDTYLKRVGVGVFELKTEIIPLTDGTGYLGHSDKRIGHIYAANVDTTNYILASLTVGGFLIVTTGRVLQNVTADVAIIASGQFPLARLPRYVSGYVLEAEGAGFDPMYVNPNGRYTPASHDHAAGNIASGVLDEARIPHTLTDDLNMDKTSPVLNLKTGGVIKADFGHDGTNGFLTSKTGDLVIDAYSANIRPSSDGSQNLGSDSYRFAYLKLSGGVIVGGNAVVGARQSAITNPTGGSTQDAEARTAIGNILSALRSHGLIAT